MIYEFNYGYKHFENFKKKLRLPALIFAVIAIIFIGTIFFMLRYKYYTISPFENSFDILFTVFVCCSLLLIIYYSFYNTLLISIFKRLAPPNDETQVAILNSDNLIISNKNVEYKIAFDEIISCDFSDSYITIKANNDVFIIPIYFKSGEEFSELFYNCLQYK